MKKAHLQTLFVDLQRLFVGLQSRFAPLHWVFAGPHSPLVPLHPSRAAVHRVHGVPHTASAALRMPSAAAHRPFEALHAAIAGRQTSIVGLNSAVLPSVPWYADRISTRVGVHAASNVSRTPRCSPQITLVHPITPPYKEKTMPRFPRTEPEIAALALVVAQGLREAPEAVARSHRAHKGGDRSAAGHAGRARRRRLTLYPSNASPGMVAINCRSPSRPCGSASRRGNSMIGCVLKRRRRRSKYPDSRSRRSRSAPS